MARSRFGGPASAMEIMLGAILTQSANAVPLGLRKLLLSARLSLAIDRTSLFCREYLRQKFNKVGCCFTLGC